MPASACITNGTTASISVAFRLAIGPAQLLHAFRATLRWPGHLVFGDPLTARQPRLERGGCAEARWRDVHESPERLAREVHRPHVSPAHDGIEFVVRDSHHQIAANDSAAHPTAAEESEATEHLALGDVVPSVECLANPIRESLVVRHRDPTANGSTICLP